MPIFADKEQIQKEHAKRVAMLKDSYAQKLQRLDMQIGRLQEKRADCEADEQAELTRLEQERDERIDALEEPNHG